MLSLTLISCLMCCLSGAAGAQVDQYSFNYRSYYGQRDVSGYVYVLVFMNITADQSDNTGFHQVLMSSGSGGANTHLEIPKMGINSYISLNSTTGNPSGAYNLTRKLDLVYTMENRTVQKNAVIVTSNKKIQIFGTRSNQGTTEGYLALPLMKNSKSFWLTSYKTSKQGVSSFAIASVLDGACVEGYRVNGTHYNRVFAKQLGKNDVFIESNRDEDYSGIFINSTRPIAVFSGHECAQVPVETKFCDHLIEQVPPADNLGTYFVVAPIFGRTAVAGYELRVVATENDTQIYIKATNERAYLHRGWYHHSQLQTDATIPTIVTCSKPCIVTQYNKGKRANTDEVKDTDPFMMIIPPVSHYDNDLSLQTSNLYMRGAVVDFEDWLTVVCRSTDKSGMRFNGRSIFRTWIDMAEGYSIAYFRITPGAHRLSNVNPNVTFTGFVYGHSNIEPTAYGYPIGYKLFGTPLLGTWQNSLSVTSNVETGSKSSTPAPLPSSATTAPPTARRCVISRLYSNFIGSGKGAYLSFTLVGSVPGSSVVCTSGYVGKINAYINSLRSEINDKICLSQFCNWSQHTFVDKIDVAYKPGTTTFSLTITMATGVDEKMDHALACKLQVRDFIEKYAQNWKTSVTPPSGCPDVTFSMLSNQIVCPK